MQESFYPTEYVVIFFFFSQVLYLKKKVGSKLESGFVCLFFNALFWNRLFGNNCFKAIRIFQIVCIKETDSLRQNSLWSVSYKNSS